MRSIRYICLLACLIGLAGASPVAGQEDNSFHSRFLIGFTAGADVSSGIYKYANGPEPPLVNPLVSPGGGITLDWRMARAFSLQTAFLYRGKGDRIDMKLWSDKFYEDVSGVVNPLFTLDGNGIVKTSLHYLEWSLTPTFVFGRRFELGLGGFVAAGINGRAIDDYTIRYYWGGELLEEERYDSDKKVEFVTLFPTSNDPEVKYVNRLDYGVCGHLGLRIHAFTLAAKLSVSLEKWEPNPSLFGEEADTRTQNVAMMFSVSYFLGKRE